MTFEYTEKQNQRLNNLKVGLIDFIAGSLGGVALVYVGQPLDTIKELCLPWLLM